MSTLDLRPLSIGELLDRTFSLYRRNFVMFVGISAIPYLFVLAVKLSQVAVMPVANRVRTMPPVSEFQGAPGLMSGNLGAYFAFAALGIFVSLAAVIFSQGGTVFAVSELYLGRQTT